MASLLIGDEDELDRPSCGGYVYVEVIHLFLDGYKAHVSFFYVDESLHVSVAMNLGKVPWGVLLDWEDHYHQKEGISSLGCRMCVNNCSELVFRIPDWQYKSLSIDLKMSSGPLRKRRHLGMRSDM
jgi:hypothetical protein